MKKHFLAFGKWLGIVGLYGFGITYVGGIHDIAFNRNHPTESWADLLSRSLYMGLIFIGVAFVFMSIVLAMVYLAEKKDDKT